MEKVYQIFRKKVNNKIYYYSAEEINSQQFDQTAYHGSPHMFEKFDLGAIGTGEGAQAHGWGLYFAKDKKTAELYRERLSRHGWNKFYDGKLLSDNDPIAQAIAELG